jgi:hypothetical protein
VGPLRSHRMSYHPRPTAGRAGKGRPRITWKAPPYREIQKKIGQALAADCELQQDLPGSLLRLLKRIDDSENENDVSQR